MKNTIKRLNTQGFSPIVVLAILALLVLAGSVGYVYMQPKKELSKPPESKSTSEIISPESAPVPTSSNETANWRTYRNEKYGFEVRYPDSMITNSQEGPVVGVWSLAIYDPVSAKLAKGKVPEFTLTNRSYGLYEKMTRLFTEADVDAERISANVHFKEAGKDMYSSCNLFNNFETKLSRGLALCNQILSTFKFIKNSAPLPLPTTCIDEQEGVPVITSLSAYSAPVGTKLEIRGCNFSGFEGDKNAWIENSQDVVGFLYGEAGSTGKLLRITLKSTLCQSDTSYSGLPCSAWFTLTPGTYKIYTMPWGKKSNTVSFTIE